MDPFCLVSEIELRFGIARIIAQTILAVNLKGKQRFRDFANSVTQRRYGKAAAQAILAAFQTRGIFP